MIDSPHGDRISRVSNYRRAGAKESPGGRARSRKENQNKKKKQSTPRSISSPENRKK